MLVFTLKYVFRMSLLQKQLNKLKCLIFKKIQIIVFFMHYLFIYFYIFELI